MAATPDERGGQPAPRHGAQAPFDEARLLTVGQAADLLGVAHVTLRQWVRAGRLVAHSGRKGGLEIDLVRAGDVAALDPRVRERALPKAPRLDPVNRSGTASPRGRGEDAVERRPTLPADVPAPSGPTTVEWSAELAGELERLRAELAEERARSRARAVELEAAERDLRRLLARPTEPPVRGTERRAQQTLPSDGGSPAAHAPRRGLPRMALLPALVLGFVARPWLTPTPAGALAGDETRLGEARPLDASDARAPAPANVVVRVEEAAAESAERAPTAPPLDVPTASPDVALDVDTGSDDVVPDDTVTDAVVTDAAHDFSGRLTARDLDPLAYTPVDGPPCAFAGHAADLGPCMGPPTLAGDAVAGTHRVDGVDCCRHHQLAQRLGGDLAQLSATAELARQEGVLPPLVAARIARAVGPFLRARCGAWRAAGIDGVQGQAHAVRLDARGVVSVETWIELEPPLPVDATPGAASDGQPGTRRHVRLAVELSDGVEGDVLLELVTLTGSTEVAAGAALAVPGADESTAGTER